MNNTGMIVLPTLSAAMIWKGELLGQFSDGMWENSGPHGHFEFWYGLQVVVNAEVAPHVLTAMPRACKKTGYNIASLYDIVGGRMVALGRMGRALEKLGMTLEMASYDLRGACEEMANMQYTEFLTAKEKGFPGMHEHQFNRLTKVPLEVAAEFYRTVYTMRDLRDDVKSIKVAMKSVKR